MYFKCGDDLNDFLFYAELIKQDDTSSDMENSYKSYEVLRDCYKNNHLLQSYYNSYDLGFRDYLQRNAIIN